MIPISVCIITKNEAENLEKCLSALKLYPFEIVVTDTGSNDSSKEIAEKYADKVLDFAWCDDFSAARNFCISNASHNIILSLDTDEFVTEIDSDSLEKLIVQNPTAVGRIELLNYFDTNSGRRAHISRVDRLFDRRHYTYRNRIHEYLHTLGNISYSTYEAPLTADHVGYLGSKEKLRDKSMRDINLLVKELDATPDNPYLHFQIGQSYLMMRDDQNACKYFAKALNYHPDPAEDYTRILIKNYGESLLSLGLTTEASSLLSYYSHYEDNADYLCLAGCIYLQLNQPLRALPEFIKAQAAPKRDSLDSATRTPAYYIGFIYELFGEIDIAKSHYLRCGDYTPALKRLEAIKN